MVNSFTDFIYVVENHLGLHRFCQQIFLKNRRLKAKSKIPEKIGEKLENWVSENCKDGHTLLQWSQTGLNQHVLLEKQLKDRDTLIEQSPCCELL